MRRGLAVDIRLALRRAVRFLTFRRVASNPAPLRIPVVLALLGILVLISVGREFLASGWQNLNFNEYGLATIFASLGVIAFATAFAARRLHKPNLSRAMGDIAGIWVFLDLAYLAMVVAYMAAGLDDAPPSTVVTWIWWTVGWGLLAYASLAVWRAGRSIWQGRLRFPGFKLATVSLLPLILIPNQPVVYGTYTNWDRQDVWYWSSQAYATLAGTNQYDPASDDYEEEPSLLEDTLYRQAALLNGTLGAIMPNDETKPEYFFLAAAPNGWQDVFASEVTKAKAIFDERFGTRGHSAVLITSSETRETVPLANTKNIEVALQEIGKLMDRENDVLVLYITSHGNVGTVSVYLEGHTLNQITPDILANALDNAAIKNRVLIISACHSGSFIPRLENPNTLIMAAARTDRTSFGCANGREWTYFGDALFNNALRQETDFVKAFEKARALIEKWEFWRVMMLQKRSEPQISVGAEIVKVLARMPPGGSQQSAAVINELRK